MGNTSFTVSAGGDRNLLVDCGPSIPTRLMELGLVDDISDILITHCHADHIGGLEMLAFYSYFNLNRRGGNLPTLHVGSEQFAHDLWHHSLKGGMGRIQDDKGVGFDTNLETYFQIKVGTSVSIPSLPEIDLVPVPHVAGMENYGIKFGKRMYYSGDTYLSPPHEPELIFQDCHFGESSGGDVHLAYEKLKSNIPVEVRTKIYLTHLGADYENHDPVNDGFAGFVMPDDEFEID